MKKIYWVMKTPGNTKEWIQMNGKQFYEFIMSPAGKGRYFMDCDDYKIEVSPEQYRKWKSETRHHEYLQTFEAEVLILSLEHMAEDIGISSDELAADSSVNVEDEAINNIDLQKLSEAVLSLEDDERWLITEFYMRDKLKTDREVAALTGLSHQAVNKNKNKILKKLKFLVAKNKKSGQ